MHSRSRNRRDVWPGVKRKRHKKKPPRFESGFFFAKDFGSAYATTRYARSPASFFEDSTFSPIFLPTLAERNPRTL